MKIHSSFKLLLNSKILCDMRVRDTNCKYIFFSFEYQIVYDFKLEKWGLRMIEENETIFDK